jgi:proteasome accessory factor A
VLRHDRAGDAIAQEALRALGLEGKVSFIRNNVDHYSGATFGCHENYLLRRAAPLTETNLRSLLTFLTLRMLYTSAGRVGATAGAEGRGEWPRSGAGPGFQISQRADYINNDLFEWVQFNRAIINTRDEPLADARKYRRLHLLHGDTNVLPCGLLLKVGTTALVLDLLEMNCLPMVMIEDAVGAFRRLSRQPDGPWLVRLSDGRCVEAVAMLQEFERAARKELGGRDAETDQLLEVWKETLEALGENPASLAGRVDWITKRWLLQEFCDREKLSWSDGWLKSQDLEYHQVDPARSLGLAAAQTPAAWEAGNENAAQAALEAPANTRASARARVMRLLREEPCSYYIDWEIIGVEGSQALLLPDPFDASPKGVEKWVRFLR